MTTTRKHNKTTSEKKINNREQRSPLKPVKTAMTRMNKKGMKGGATTLASTAAGAVIGATVGGLAGAALSDTKTRKAVTQGISRFAKTAQDSAKRLNERADDIKAKTNNVIDTTKTLAENSNED